MGKGPSTGLAARCNEKNGAVFCRLFIDFATVHLVVERLSVGVVPGEVLREGVIA